MRVRKSEDRKKSNDPAADAPNLPFQLGELVLCRYSSYPYWPATVDVTHQQKQRGRYVRWTPGPDRILSFWCTFCNEDSGGWVRADRMVRFHPELVKYVTVTPKNESFHEQAQALAAAQIIYDMFVKDKGPQPVPDAPADLKEKHEGDSDDEDDDVEEDVDDAVDRDDDEDVDNSTKKTEPKRRRSTGSLQLSHRKQGVPAPPRPKAKKEPRKQKRKSAPLTSPRPKKKTKSAAAQPKSERRRSTAKKGSIAPAVQLDEMDVVDGDDEDAVPVSQGRRASQKRNVDRTSSASKVAELERSLEAANLTVSKLKRSLRKKENQIAELTDGSPAVRVNVPATPEVTDLPLPSKEEFRSVPMDGEEFTKVMAELRTQYDVFTENVRKASSLRQELEDETKAVQEKIGKVIESVAESEKKAAESETQLAAMLRNILVADVTVQDLRSHKAGNLLKAMTKKCKEMQLIFDYSSAIYEAWMTQVMTHMGTSKKPKSDLDTAEAKKEAADAKAGNGSKEAEKKSDMADTSNAEKDDLAMNDSSGDEGKMKSDPSTREKPKLGNDDVKMKDANGTGKEDDKMAAADNDRDKEVAAESEKKVATGKEEQKEVATVKEDDEKVTAGIDGDQNTAGGKELNAKDNVPSKGEHTVEEQEQDASRSDGNDEKVKVVKEDGSDGDKKGSGKAAMVPEKASEKKEDFPSKGESTDAVQEVSSREDNKTSEKPIIANDGENKKAEPPSDIGVTVDANSESKETPRSVTAPADSMQGEQDKESVGVSEVATSTTVQKDGASEKGGRPKPEAPEQKLPPSAGGKEPATA